MKKLAMAIVFNLLVGCICYSATPVWVEVVGVEGLRVLANDDQTQQYLQLSEPQVGRFKELWKSISNDPARTRRIRNWDENAKIEQKVGEQVQTVLTEEQTQKLAWRYLKSRLEPQYVSAIFSDEGFLRGVGVTPTERTKIMEVLRQQASRMARFRVDQFKEHVDQFTDEQRIRARKLLGEDWIAKPAKNVEQDIPDPPVIAALDSYETVMTLSISPHQRAAIKLTEAQSKQVENWMQTVREYDSSIRLQEKRHTAGEIFDEIAGPLALRSLLSDEQLQLLTQIFARGLVQSGGFAKLMDVPVYARYLSLTPEQKRACDDLVIKHNQTFLAELGKLEKEATIEILALLNRESQAAIKRFLGDDLEAGLAGASR